MSRLLRFLVPLTYLLLAHVAAAQPEQEVTPPKLAHFEPAPYPLDASSGERADATVVLRLDIDKTGVVTQAEVVASAGAAFDTAAVDAAKKLIFEPARRGEELISVRILFKYVFTPPPPGPVAPVENVTGEVYHRWSKTPLANVAVEIVGLERSTMTDAQGRFRFEDVPAGEHILSFSGEGLVTGSVTQEVVAEKQYALRVGLEPVPEQIEGVEEIDDVAVVRAPRIRKEVVESQVERAQGERVAGTQGDVVKVVQTLGGVARTTAGAGELVVWGAAPADTRLYVDWIPVPRLFHLGGARSILPSEFVSSLNLVPGGFGAEWGRAIGGYVRVDTAEPDEKKRLEARATGDLIDVGAGAQAFVGPRTWSAASARRSLLSETFEAVADDRSHELVPIADYWDYQGKIRHDLSRTRTLTVIGLGSSDRIDRGIPSLTPDLTFRENVGSSFHRVGLELERTDDSESVSRLASWIGVDDSHNRQRFGTVKVKGEQHALRGGLRIDEGRRIASYAFLRFGLDLEYAHTASRKDGALSLPAREGDVVSFGQPPGNRINRDEWAVDHLGLGFYTSTTFEFAEKTWSVEPGLRFEPSVLNGDRVLPVQPTEPAVGYTKLQLGIEPRLRVTWQPAPQLSLYGAAGYYRQPPAAAELSPVFGNPMLEQPRALHVLAGTKVAAGQWLQWELTGFLVRQEQLTVRSQEATPALAEVLTSRGEGRVLGAQSSLRIRVSDELFAWATYSLMRAQRRAGEDQPWRLFDSDQTHVAQAVASWAQQQGFELGGSVQLSTGFPRTPVVDAVYNAQSAQYDPVFGEQNSTRLPLFFQASVRLGWRYVAEAWQLRVWLDVQNVTNHGNAEEIIYTSDYARHGFVEGLPILPVLGAEIKLWKPQ